MPDWLRFMRCNSPASALVESALRIETCSRSARAGLTTKSTAPARIAEMTLSMPPCAVCTITGTAEPASRRRAKHAEAVELGHHEIEHHAIDPPGVALGQEPDGLFAAFGGQCAITEFLRHVFQQAALDRIVIDDQNAFTHGSFPGAFSATRQREIVPIWGN